MIFVRIRNFIMEKLNDLSIRNKLMLVYVTCMFIPLILTDGVILSLLNLNEKKEERYQMEAVSESVKYILGSALDEAITVINSIYLNEDIYAFLSEDFESNYDFYEHRMTIKNSVFNQLDRGRESSIMGIIIYGENEGIINGGNFYNIEAIKDMGWYEDMGKTKSPILLSFYYVGNTNPGTLNKKRVSIVRALDHFKWYEKEMLVDVDLDYGVLQRKLLALSYTDPVYLCDGDRILLSNTKQTSAQTEYETLNRDADIGFETTWTLYGRDYRIVVTKNENGVMDVIKNNLGIISVLIIFNILAPILVILFINRSFAGRLYALSRAFEDADIDNISRADIKDAGNDEIGHLMRNYNRMVDRLNSLIKTTYTAKLETQETELARQSAELSALHSQINPHFLFNILETIRMRSVLKKETETANMIEKMATLVRQNISWSTDSSSVAEELSFIRSYLELQQYRFGDRLKFDIESEEECGSYPIPRLTLTTFVENACVHGMEGKTSACWVYVRVFRKGGDLVMEIEDTGQGMPDEDVIYLNDKMNNCTLDDIKGGSHVGMLNACLRLKMCTEDEARFEIESEMEVGTFITIKVPIRRLEDDDQGDAC
ncbi:MAG: sensor histidine kinase [Lachnospiraceae bacterium]|nr:sensor histidine kinase [Lachnospiraceae bacterium]